MANMSELSVENLQEKITKTRARLLPMLIEQAKLVRVDGLRRFSREEPSKLLEPLTSPDRARGTCAEMNGKFGMVTESGEIWIGSRMASQEVLETRATIKRLFSRNDPLFPQDFMFLQDPFIFSSHDLLKRFANPNWMPEL